MSKLYGAERVAQIRAKLKEKYPYIKFSITKDGYNGVNIRILEAPIDFSDEENPKAKETLKDIKNIASEGVTYRETGDYGNQPDFYVWVRVGSYDKPFVYKPSASPTTSGGGTRKPFTRGTTTTNYDKGTLVFVCDSGWKVYKKTLPDNRIVYNAIKDKDVASNKNDWNAIKGEVYVEAGFKWGRFGAFERWGEIEDENNVLTNLCAVLRKYYTNTSQSTPATQTPTPTTTTDVSSPQPTQPQAMSEPFIYGDNLDVPTEYGADLIIHLIRNYNYAVYTENTKYEVKFSSALGFEYTLKYTGRWYLVLKQTNGVGNNATIKVLENDGLPANPYKLAEQINNYIVDWETDALSIPQPTQTEPPQPQGDVEQETRKLLRSLELIRGDGTNQEIEQLIRALRLILK